MSDDTHKDAQERAERVLGKVYMAEKEREEKEELDRVTSLRNFQRVTTTKRNRNFRKKDFSSMGDTSPPPHHHHHHESYDDNNEDDNEYRGGEEEEEDSISITSQVSCLTMPQLQDKLRSSQITLMKLKENSTLKYLRLQQEHNRLKDSLPTLECKVSDAKEVTKQLLKERDDAKQQQQQQTLSKQQDRILKRIANENESLRIKLQQLKQTSAQFLNERDQYGRMVESCTCRGTELKDVDNDNPTRNNKNRRDILQRRQSTRTKQGYGPPSYTRRNSSSYFSTSGRTHNSIHTSVSSDLTRKGSDKNIDWDKDGYLY